MTPKQQRFVEEYLVDLNAKEAAIRAGYKPTTAKEQGYQLLHSPSLHRQIARAMAERSRRTGVNADLVVRELARIAFVNPAHVINFSSATVREGVSDDDIAAVASVKCKEVDFGGQDGGGSTEREVKLHDKIKALDLLAKHLGMYDKHMADEGDEEAGNSGVIILPPAQPAPDPPSEEGGGDG